MVNQRKNQGVSHLEAVIGIASAAYLGRIALAAGSIAFGSIKNGIRSVRSEISDQLYRHELLSEQASPYFWDAYMRSGGLTYLGALHGLGLDPIIDGNKPIITKASHINEVFKELGQKIEDFATDPRLQELDQISLSQYSELVAAARNIYHGTIPNDPRTREYYKDPVMRQELKSGQDMNGINFINLNEAATFIEQNYGRLRALNHLIMAGKTLLGEKFQMTKTDSIVKGLIPDSGTDSLKVLELNKVKR